MRYQADMGCDKRVKCVLIGDGAVGKTCLFAAYAYKKFPKDYIPTVKNKQISVDIWDTAGQENFGAIRELSYPNADVFIICYSSESKASFANIWQGDKKSARLSWRDEIRELGAPFIICGTKDDLYNSYNPKHVSSAEAERKAISEGAWNSYRCSAKYLAGVDEVFKGAIKCALNKGKQSPLLSQGGTGICTIF